MSKPRKYFVTSWSTARNGRRYLRTDTVLATCKLTAERSAIAKLHAIGRRLVVVWKSSRV